MFRCRLGLNAPTKIEIRGCVCICGGGRNELKEIWAGVKTSFPKITSEIATDLGVEIPAGQLHYHVETRTANKSLHLWISGMLCNWFWYYLIRDRTFICVFIFFQGPWHRWWHFSTSASRVNATLICAFTTKAFTGVYLLTSTHTTPAYSSAFFFICLFVYLLRLWDILSNLCTAFLLCPTLGQGPCGLGAGGSGLGGGGRLQIASHDSWLFVFFFRWQWRSLIQNTCLIWNKAAITMKSGLPAAVVVVCRMALIVPHCFFFFFFCSLRLPACVRAWCGKRDQRKHRSAFLTAGPSS